MSENSDVGARNYRHLLTSIAQAESLDKAKFLSDQCFEKDGVRLSFEHLPQSNLCRIGFALGPTPRDMEALKAMLESNAFPEKGLLPIMAIDPESGQAMVFVHFPAIEEAEMAVHCFLGFGIVMLAEQWKELWKEELNPASGAICVLA